MSESPSTVPVQRTLLVVDDQESVRLSLEFVLSASGYQVIGAQSGPDAVALAAQIGFDGVLIDVHMPGWDGYETCRRLQAQAREVGRTLRIWFITGMAGGPVQRRAIELGTMGVIAKPFHCAALAAQIEAGFTRQGAEPNGGAVQPA